MSDGYRLKRCTEAVHRLWGSKACRKTHFTNSEVISSVAAKEEEQKAAELWLLLLWETVLTEDPCFYCIIRKGCLRCSISSSKLLCVLQALIAARNIHNLYGTIMNKSLMNLWEGLITLQTRVTSEIQFMLRSQRFEIIGFNVS